MMKPKLFAYPRSRSALGIASVGLLVTALSAAATPRGAFNNVPEATNYCLVYSLNIPNTPNYNPGLIYDVDLRAYYASFVRVAYYLELTTATTTNYVWVSFDPVTYDVNQIGVPTVTSGAIYQQPIANMNVFSSVATITSGTNYQGGNMEFWPGSYNAVNANGVPNASDTAYDWGDTRTSGNYGSMQLANADLSQMLLAFNRWGGTGGTADIGIGNQTANAADLDWTFAQNAASYTVKTLQVYVLPATYLDPPVPVSAVGQTGWTNVVITFSKPLTEAATNLANYAINGLSVTKAVLEPFNKQAVTLTTSAQQPFTTYTVTLNGLVDRSSNQVPIAANSTVPFTSVLNGRGALANVPEAANYSLVYSLDIPNSPSYAKVPYDLDLHALYTNFTRVAYYLELQTATGPLTAMWVSLDAFTNDVTQVGVPTVGSGAVFQQPVANMNVRSSAAPASGTNLQGGTMEFWPQSYTQGNAAGVTNASDTVFDWGDTRSATGNYGSMQIANAAASQMVFAFNRWAGGVGTAGFADVGLGSCPPSLVANPDWTFAYNTWSYTVKTLQVYVQSPALTNAPLLVSATGLAGWTNVILTFSKPLADNATNTANYAIGGLTVTKAVLEPINKLRVTLTTSTQQPATLYTVTVNGLKDRTASATALAPNSTATFLSSRPRGILNNVAEAADFSLVYSLDIPNAPNYANGLTYTIDLHTNFSTFSRVAYYLELQDTNGLNFLWLSMDPFTSDVTQIGVPTLSSGANFQQPVANVNVLSSVPSIVNGTSLMDCNMEFWPYNYSAPNAIGVPGASDTTYDWGDTVSGSGNYGSMQFGNSDASQVLFAFNRWAGTGGTADLGIGNSPISVNPDWTFSLNASNYTVKTLQVLVQVASNQPPAILYALGGIGGSSATLTFSKPVAESATNLANYALSGGVRVLGATLDPLNKSVVTLTTSPQLPSTLYTVTVNGVTDRMSPPNPIAPNSTATFLSGRVRGAYNNAVPEAPAYSLVYSLDIPAAAVYSPSVTYTIDRRAVNTNFTRIAYYLELQDSNALNYIWVSMDAFTNNVNAIGVPTSASGGFYQRYVTNMDVFSSVASIVQGSNFQTGNLEFWPSNYSGGNALNIPNASATLYDWGDTFTSGNYGCMQIANYGASQMLLCFNRWGGNGNPVDVGIGNAPSGNPDWTFAYNANNYTVRTLQVYVLPASNPPPVLLSAAGVIGNTSVTLNFNKALDESATNVANYALSGGLSVLAATLDPLNKYTVTLTTTPQTPLVSYTVTVNGISDRGSPALAIAPNSTASFVALRRRGALNNVAEAPPYVLVYSLDIPNTPNYSAGITYTVDQRANIGRYSRVAYYLELQPTGGPLDFMWVSMDAFTANVNRIGVPTVSSGALFQQFLSNVNVVSSVSGIVNGTGIQTGNMEFWPSNYAAANSANVPNASASTLDWGDSGASTAAGYGSMQVANYGASQMLFAFNRWGGAGGNADVGIGNCPASVSTNPDWTFAQNAATYAIKTLQVYVLPSFRVTAAGTATPGQFSTTWEALAGTTYSIWRKAALDASPWTKVGSVTATSNTATFTDSGGGATAFYRISIP